jgi:hypothetical protein
MKKWFVPAIISAFALSLFEMWVSPVTESGPLPPNQEKVAKTIARLPVLAAFNLVPGINFFLFYFSSYHQALQKQSPLSPSNPKADEAARNAAGTVTFLGFLLWLGAWIIVVLLKPKWWYIVVGFVLTVGAAVWISQLPDSSLPGWIR